MRVAVISDVHSNLVALEAVIRHLPAVEAIWSLGDAVGYGPQPNECLSLLRDKVSIAIAGNHDWGSLGKVGFEDFNDAAAVAARWTGAQLTAQSRAYLAGLKMQQEMGEFSLVHGSPRDPLWDYLANASRAEACFPLFKGQYCLVGHTHVPAVFSQDEQGGAVHVSIPRDGARMPLAKGKAIYNPGSVGQPRDGDPRAAYAVLDLNERTISFARVEYDFGATQARMQAVGLPEFLWKRLEAGR